MSKHKATNTRSQKAQARITKLQAITRMETHEATASLRIVRVG